MVTIVIVSYNTRQLLLECIESIRRVTKYPSYRIVVVDNGSTDGSPDAVKHAPNTSVIYNRQNLGFGGANNVALNAESDFFLLLNPDTILVNDAVTEFVRFYESHGNARTGVMGAYLTDALGREAHSFAPQLSIGLILRELVMKLGGMVLSRYRRRRAAARKPLDRIVRKVDTVVGAAMFVSEGAIRRVGGFDERYFMYHEEADWQRNLRRHGYTNLLIPGPSIVHKEGQSSKSVNRRRIMVQTSHVVYVRKWYGLLVYPFKLCLLTLLFVNMVVDLFKMDFGLAQNWHYLISVAREKYR